MPNSIGSRPAIGNRVLLAVLFCSICLCDLFFNPDTTRLASADERRQAGDADQYLARLKKWLGRLEEVDFRYKSHATRSTPAEGACGKWETSGHVCVSASHRSLHYTQSGRSTWAKEFGELAEEPVTTEVVLDAKSRLQVITLINQQLSPEPVVDVKVTQPVSKGEWSKTLAEHELGLLFGYLPAPIRVKGLPNATSSLTALCQRATCDLIEREGDGKEKLTGIRARAAEYEIRALFDPSNDGVLRQVEFERNADHVEPSGLRRAVLEIVAAGRDGPELPSMEVTMVLEYSPEKVSPSASRPGVGEGLAIAKGAEAISEQTYIKKFEISAIAYDVKSPGGWSALGNPIPDGTPVELNGNFMTHYWQNGKVKSGIPPTPEKILQDKLRALFAQDEPPVRRYQSAIADIKQSRQHCLVVFADPFQNAAKELYAICFKSGESPELIHDFRAVGVSTSSKERALALELAKTLDVKLPGGNVPLLVIADGDGRLVGQSLGNELLATDKKSIDRAKVDDFLERHSPPKVDAKSVLADALNRARQENKKVLLQQTATWCRPCWLLNQFLNRRRALWEKDYVWLTVDERWSHAGEVMAPIRSDDAGGIPWIAILDADGKVLVTSDRDDGQNIGFPTADDRESIAHFMRMLRQTAARMTSDELKSIERDLGRPASGTVPK